MKKIYVGNLALNTSEEAVAALFEKYGPIASCRLIRDRDTNASRGFAFVELENSDNADLAIKELDGFELDGSGLKISEARPKRDDGPRGGGGGRPPFRGGGGGGRSFGGGGGNRGPRGEGRGGDFRGGGDRDRGDRGGDRRGGGGNRRY